MSASNSEYVESLKDPIYDWFVLRAVKGGSVEPVKISDCKEDFKAINIIHLTSVFELLVADSKISLSGGRSRVQHFCLNEENENYNIKKASIIEEQARLDEINKAVDGMKKLTKKRGLAVRDSNIEQPIVKWEKGDVIKTVSTTHKKPKIPQCLPANHNDQNNPGVNGLCAVESNPLPVAATNAAEGKAPHMPHEVIREAQSYHFVPSSELKAKNELESDALAALLMDSFADGELKYYTFRELVLNKFPLIDDQMFSSLITQFEQQNKIFVDGDDIYQI